MERDGAILVRVPNWIGDVVMSFPALQQLRAARPNVKITVVAKPWVADLVHVSQCADEVLVYSPRAGFSRITDFVQMVRNIRQRKCAVALLFQNAFEAAALAAAGGIPLRIGRARDGRRYLLTHPIAESRDPNRHQMHDYLDIVEQLAPGIEREFHPVTLPQNLLARADELLDGLEELGTRPLAAIAPGARGTDKKRWPPAHFATVADGLARNGVCVLLLGSVYDGEATTAVAAAMTQPYVDLTGKLPLIEALAVTARAGVLVSNDSGAMHLAAAAGTPVVAVFGPTNARATGPLGQGHRIFQSPAAADRSRDRAAAQYGQDFSTAPSEVLAAALDILGLPASDARSVERGC